MLPMLLWPLWRLAAIAPTGPLSGNLHMLQVQPSKDKRTDKFHNFIFAYNSPVFPTLFIEEIIFLPLYGLVSSVID